MYKKVLLLENINSIAEEKFRERNFYVESLNKSLSQEELCSKIKEVSVLGIRSKTKISKEVLDNANNLVGVGAFCIGTDQIDLSECSRRGIGVFNAPFSNTRSVAELAIGELIMLLRGIYDKNRLMHEGIWNKSSKNSVEVRGKKLGIVGYGKIGSQVSIFAENLGMKVYYFDTEEKLNLGNAKKCGSLEELLGISDVVSLHVDGRKENRKFFGKEYFQRMKKGSYFLNLSRGFVIDDKALEEEIDNGRILGAAIDVFENEPLENNSGFSYRLQNKKNVILTPHVGGNTQEAQEDIAISVSNYLNNFYFNGDSSLSVNFPALSLDKPNNQNHVARFSHFHENVPGVLAKINEAISGYKLNIAKQDHNTRGNFGYVVTNVEIDSPKNLVKELENIKGTIRLRVLE